MIGANHLLGLFFLLCLGGAVFACIAAERRQLTALAWVGSAASLCALLASIKVLVSGQAVAVELWSLLSFGTLTLSIDGLSALFVFVTALVSLAVSIFSARYMRKYAGQYSLRYFSLLYYGFLASLVLVLIAGDAFLFILAWELMSISSYLLVAYEHRREDSAQAAYLMIAMGEAGAIAVVVAFALLVNAAGALDYASLRSASSALGPSASFSVFALSFLGFGVKAGLVPLNSWLPRAHPVAPTNVSTLLSGVMVNLGIYGILRFNADLLPVADVGRGLVVLAVGAASALIGILYATIQTDLKRMLAHSTIENMGIIVVGIGAGLVFSASGYPVLAGIAFIAALYHMINHSFYKALLFIGTGAVEAGAGTRDLDRMGGLIRTMPWTAALFLIGVLAIAGLPPVNGFVSEWLTLQTILRSAVLASIPVKITFALAGAALALTAGLALTCFVKAFAMGFLGMGRSAGAEQAHEVSAGVRAPMALLAGLCILLGVMPTYVIPVLDLIATPLAHASAVHALVPPFFTAPAQGVSGASAAFLAEFHDLGAQLGHGWLPGAGLVILHQGGAKNPVVFAMSTSYMLIMLACLFALVYALFRWVTRGRTLARGAVWDGGIRRLWAQTTYTATGFSNPVRVIFHAIFRPASAEDTTEAVAVHFRTAIRREYSEVHIVDRWVLRPAIAATAWLAGILRRMHIGHVNAYAGYVLAMVLLVLVIGRWRDMLELVLNAMGFRLQ